MSDHGASIVEGLRDAIAYARGDKRGSRTHTIRVHPADVRSTRERLGLTQAAFASAFGVSIATVRNWEQGRREPEGPARVLLRVIERHPEAVLESLATKRRKRA